MNPLKQGKKFYEETILEVDLDPSGGVGMHTVESPGVNTRLNSSYHVTSKIIPKPGMIIRFYGEGPWCRVDGIDINGIEIFYKTEEDWKREADALLLKIAEFNPKLAADLKKNEYDKALGQK